MKTQKRQLSFVLLLLCGLARPNHSLAASPDAAVGWGGNTYGQATVPLEAQRGVTALAGGAAHTLALKQDGSVLAWGENSVGQSTVPSAARSGVTAIAAGCLHSLALKTNGAVVAWGDNSCGQTNVPLAALAGVIAIAAGYSHSVALNHDGAVVAWGDNRGGQINVPAEAQSGIQAIAAGYSHTVALKNDGSVLAWGDNSYGQITVPAAAQSGVVAIAAGCWHTLALKKDGGVVAWGDNACGQITVPAAAQSGVRAIAAGEWHSVALKNDGAVLAWGYNGNGETIVPASVQGQAVAVAAGCWHTLVIATPVTPTIFSPPTSQAALAGDATSFAVVARGHPLNYQWRFHGTNLAGATTSVLRLENVSSNHVGSYSAVVWNPEGAVTSAVATLSVSYVPPAGQIYLAAGTLPAPAGSDVTFCSRISGAPAPTCQWQVNGTNLPGQMSGCLYLGNLSSNQAGLYRLVASNVAGAFTSAPIALDVSYFPPTGSLSPSGALPPAPAGSMLALYASISAAPPATCQWQFNETDLPGETGYCLYLHNLQARQNGSYRFIARNMLGCFTSEVAVVSVAYAPPTASIYLGSGHTPTTVGNSITLGASTSGAPPPAMQWQFNGIDLPGANCSTLYLTNLQTSDSGNFTIVASNLVGVVTSAVAVITVIPPQPVLAYFGNAAPPFRVGDCLSLGTEVTLPGPTALQWCFNGTNLLDATNDWLYLCPIRWSDAGQYSVAATTASGLVYTSPPIALTVFYAPASAAQPLFLLGRPAALVGEDVRLMASYDGSPCDIQWQFNGTDLTGQTNQYLTLLAVTTNHAGDYAFTAKNPAGTTSSAAVTLTVAYQAPLFSLQPASQSVVEGATARFQAYATAGPPPLYFLEKDGTNVAVPFTFAPWSGVAQGGFSLLDTTAADAGNYWVVASNSLGCATSAVVTLTITPAGPLDRWAQRNPLPQADSILAVARGTNQFVAVGDRGAILTSADGLNWALQSRRADLALNGIAYGAGLFLAVGAGGTILSSPDGTNWAYRYLAPDATLNAVTFGQGQFVALGYAAVGTLIVHSTDAIAWDRIALPDVVAERCVAYGNGRFVAGGSSSLLVSLDSTNWTLAQNVSRAVEAATYAAGVYVAVGDNGSILVSDNALFWQSRPPVTSRRLLGVTYGAGRFVAAGARGTLLASTDALAWSAVTSGTPDRLETVAFGDGRFIAAGENGTMIASTNATSWTKQNLGVTRDLDGLDVANGILVAVGKGGSIMTSTDGVHFTTQNSGVTNDLHGVTWGGGLWVAMGEPGTVLTSSNAVDWVSHASGSTNSLKDGVYANGQWILVGTQGSIVRSTDGHHWSTTFTTPPFDLNDVAYGNGVFLVAGDGLGNQNGSLFQSYDGSVFALVSFNPGKNLRGVTFANGLFLFTANDGLLLTTANGTPGSFHVINALFTLGAGNLRAAGWAGDLWTVVGNNGAIFTSADLVSWTRRGVRTFENLHRVACLDGKLVTIGNRGTVLQSGRFVTEFEQPVLVSGTGLELRFKGIINHPYKMQVTTNLAAWLDLATFTNLAEHSLFLDTNALQRNQGFYRLAEP